MHRTAAWLQHNSRHSLGFFDLTIDLERHLSKRALAGRTSRTERDALFIDLGAIVSHAVLRYRSWSIEPWDLEDIAQESYLAFTDTHNRWLEQVWIAPDDTAQPGFGRYALRIFPLRLADRVDVLLGVSHAHLLDGTAEPETEDNPDPWVGEDDIRTRELISSICCRLSSRDAITLRRIVASGFSIRAVARQTGEHPRTLYHRWERITQTARAVVLGCDDATAA